MSGYKYYRKNACYRVSRSEYFGAHGAEQQIPEHKSSPAHPPNYEAGQKCYECGRKSEKYIIDWIGRDFRVLCSKCQKK